MWFWFFLISLCVNILLLLYVRWLLNTLAVINQDTQDLTLIIRDFSKHLQAIHELEMFYGDETLKSLIDHSRLIIENIENMMLSKSKIDLTFRKKVFSTRIFLFLILLVFVVSFFFLILNHLQLYTNIY